MSASAEGGGAGPAARVELRLLGQTLALRTQAPPDYLRSLAAYIEERVGTIHRSGVRDATTALLLAALDIADELFRAREDHARGEQDVRARIDSLVALLESASRDTT
ncbi:MAG: cell division protein ZapA [Candidatus Rokubacteria bacterium]|nr:cell division protein ZapA [Candidatus Rokubacteria bacterium]